MCHPEKLKVMTTDLDSYSTVKHIVSWGKGIPDELRSKITDHGLSFHTMQEIEVRLHVYVCTYMYGF